MILFKKALPRRTFLRGMGTAMALPFLESMVPGSISILRGRAGSSVEGFIYLPMGANIAKWTPPGEGKLQDDLSPILDTMSPSQEIHDRCDEPRVERGLRQG